MDFQQFLLWEGVVVMKELILTVSTLGGRGGLERTHFLSFYFGRVFFKFLLWEGVMVLKT